MFLSCFNIKINIIKYNNIIWLNIRVKDIEKNKWKEKVIEKVIEKVKKEGCVMVGDLEQIAMTQIIPYIILMNYNYFHIYLVNKIVI